MAKLADRIFSCFKSYDSFSLSDAYSHFSENANETIRARIYENLGIKFQRIAKGVYKTISGNQTCILIEGDGRDLSFLKDKSIDCIITDHPWSDSKSNKGGNRSFSNYDCFRYELDDFMEKSRVLKDGCFLIEILPAENANNYKYLYQIKEYAEKTGLLYYSQVTWEKGKFVSNTGRKAKNTQEVMIFSKGKARNMRFDTKKSMLLKGNYYMSGTAKMLPAMFDIEPVPTNKKIHQSELPVSLCEEIIEYVTYEDEIILDSFAGSGSVGIAALNKNRNCILVEKDKETIKLIRERFAENLYFENVV
ncbi:MAG: site-specific DNA-methyltransferase [Treponema sp.]|nr:site-specific DNA-methyltransferase [Treponema sp.]